MNSNDDTTTNAPDETEGHGFKMGLTEEAETEAHALKMHLTEEPETEGHVFRHLIDEDESAVHPSAHRI